MPRDTLDCGCTFDIYNNRIQGYTHCPLHRTPPQMLAFLQQLPQRVSKKQAELARRITAETVGLIDEEGEPLTHETPALPPDTDAVRLAKAVWMGDETLIGPLVDALAETGKIPIKATSLARLLTRPRLDSLSAP